jgi:hypothetical protein
MLLAQSSSRRVQTTQELVQKMALRSSVHADNPPTPPVPEAEQEPAMSNGLPEPSPPSPGRPTEETVEAVLARLPPIDEAAHLEYIQRLEEDSEGEDVEGLIPVLREPKQVVSPELVQELHEGQRECFNGNVDNLGEFQGRIL